MANDESTSEGPSVKNKLVGVLGDQRTIPFDLTSIPSDAIDSDVIRYYEDGGYTQRFVVTKQFKDLLGILDEGHERKIALLGPKGVGKTSSLFAVSILSKHRPCLVYYLNAEPTRFRAYASFVYKRYQSVQPPAKKLKVDETTTDLSTDIWKIVDQFIDDFREEEKPILLVDLSSWTAAELDTHEQVKRLLANACLEGVTTVVATSSGNMNFRPLQPSTSAYSIAKRIKNYTKLAFLPFSNEEANVYLSLSVDKFKYLRAEAEDAVQELKEDAVQELKELTNYNPLLLEACRNVKDFASAIENVEFHVRSFSDGVFRTLKNANFMWIASTVKFSRYMLYCAANGINVEQTEHSRYNTCWLASEGITYIAREGDSEFELALNFPLILSPIREMLQARDYTSELQLNMIIRGYRFESAVLNKLDGNDIAISYSKEGETPTGDTFKFDVMVPLRPGKPLRKMNRGVLYYLREQHPVIDAVAIVVKEDNVWLLMIQVSLSQYKDHRSKAAHLLKHITSPEKNDKNTSLNWLEYYKNLGDCSRVKNKTNKTMYVYVSPNEIDIDENPHVILGDAGVSSNTKDMYFGVILRNSKTHQEIREIVSSLYH